MHLSFVCLEKHKQILSLLQSKTKVNECIQEASTKEYETPLNYTKSQKNFYTI